VFNAGLSAFVVRGGDIRPDRLHRLPNPVVTPSFAIWEKSISQGARPSVWEIWGDLARRPPGNRGCSAVMTGPIVPILPIAMAHSVESVGSARAALTLEPPPSRDARFPGVAERFMRILYGANSQGQGHLSKAAVLVPLLVARGHTVQVVTSGPTPPPGYRFPGHRHFAGLTYRLAHGRTDLAGTAWDWFRQVPQLWRSLQQVRRLVQRFQPELIISDFEPLTASPLCAPPCEVLALSRQVALSDHSIPLPDDHSVEKKLTRTAIRLFTCGADRLYGYHYEPASYRCVPPVLRPELLDRLPTVAEHCLVYSHDEDYEALICWAHSRRQRVLAYGYPRAPRGRIGWVEFRAPSRTGMLDDLRSCRAVMTNAGLTTPIEAFLLGKPVCVVPIPGQWEQLVNAFHLERARLAASSPTWDFDQLLETPPPMVHHPLRDWLSTSPDRLLDRLLHTSHRTDDARRSQAA
jgi:uncharacterized protein (TIGR00661 family)